MSVYFILPIHRLAYSYSFFCNTPQYLGVLSFVRSYDFLLEILHTRAFFGAKPEVVIRAWI